MDSDTEDISRIRIGRRSKPKISKPKHRIDNKEDFEELDRIIDQHASDDQDDEELDDEDLFLIEENQKLVQTHGKRTRARIIDSDDEAPRKGKRSADFDDMDDFIVDDEYRRYSKKSRKKGEEDSEDESKDEMSGFKRPNYNFIQQEEPKTDVFAILDPAEIDRSHLGAADMEICSKDIPERFQRRTMQVETCTQHEINEEAEWIYKNAFIKRPSFSCAKLDESITAFSSDVITEKIRIVLNLIRNDKFDIPFISRYRKELINPVLFDVDLWTILTMDGEWMHLKDRRDNLLNLISQLVNFQQYITNHKISCPIEVGTSIKLSYIDTVKDLMTVEDVRDHYESFSFNNLPTLRKLYAFLEKALTENEFNQLKTVNLNDRKVPETRDHFDYCKKTGFDKFISMIGMTPEELGENLAENYPKNLPTSHVTRPEEIASQYVNSFLTDERAVLDHVAKLWAEELAHDPQIKGEARKFYFKHAKISCKPTNVGIIEFESCHLYSDFKYLKHKPIEAFSFEQYLQLRLAESQGLLESSVVVFNNNNQTFIEYCRPFYERDDHGDIVYAWNSLRYNGFRICVENILFPQLFKEFTLRLNEEAHRHVLNSFCKLLGSHLGVGPDPKKFDSRYVFAIALPAYKNLNPKQDNDVNDGYCSIVSTDGSLIETFQVDAALLVASFNHSELAKIQISQSLRRLYAKIEVFRPSSIVLLLQHKPMIHVAQYLQKHLICKLENSNRPCVELVNPLVPNAAGMSTYYREEFPKMTLLERQATSGARYSIDPLLEIVQLFENQDDIVAIFANQYHHSISKDLIFTKYEQVLINVVNTVGVDLQRCMNDFRYANMLKYISGLGPSKAAQLLGRMRKRRMRITARTELLNFGLGTKVYENSVGFIRIPADNDSEDVDPFDTTRIHPESYDLAREIIGCAMNAQRIKDINCSEAMLQFLLHPKKIQTLEYEKFKSYSKLIEDSDEKNLTFNDIKAELCSPFEDRRSPYHPLNEEEIFWVIGTNGLYFDRGFIKDPFNPLAPGNFVSGVVGSYAYSRPTSMRFRDTAKHDEAANIYQCPFCRDRSFKNHEEMNKHCETGCNVLFIGIRIKLENGLNGFIPKDNLLTDKKENIREKLQIGTVINARIVSVNEKKFNVELSYKSDDTLGFKHGEKGRDTYYDTFSEKEDMYNLQEKKNRLSNRVMYHKKLIVHPLFKNVTFDEAENLLKQKEELDCVIRPSSKGVDKLSLSIKIIDDIIVHVDIKEEEKANDYSLGKKLYIQNELYEDLDEIYASYVTPYLNYFAEVTKHKNYLFVSESDEEVIQNELKKQMTETPGGTPYLISISRSYPGKIFLAYFHKSKVQFQYVSISNHGFSIKNIAHPTIESVLTWVKSSRQEARPTPSDRGKGYTPRYDSSVPPSSKFPHVHSSRSGTSMHHRTYSSSSSVHNWPR